MHRLFAAAVLAPSLFAGAPCRALDRPFATGAPAAREELAGASGVDLEGRGSTKGTLPLGRRESSSGPHTIIVILAGDDEEPLGPPAVRKGRRSSPIRPETKTGAAPSVESSSILRRSL